MVSPRLGLPVEEFSTRGDSLALPATMARLARPAFLRLGLQNLLAIESLLRTLELNQLCWTLRIPTYCTKTVTMAMVAACGNA